MCEVDQARHTSSSHVHVDKNHIWEKREQISPARFTTLSNEIYPEQDNNPNAKATVKKDSALSRHTQPAPLSNRESLLPCVVLSCQLACCDEESKKLRVHQCQYSFMKEAPKHVEPLSNNFQKGQLR